MHTSMLVVLYVMCFFRVCVRERSHAFASVRVCVCASPRVQIYYLFVLSLSFSSSKHYLLYVLENSLTDSLNVSTHYLITVLSKVFYFTHFSL